jgi:GH15 family glucan-1,4-alpha-glucosidase
MKRTYHRVEEHLGTGNGLLYRYVRQPHEGAFGICCFWAVEYLALGGTLEQAHRRFARLLKYGNDLGLFAEEVDPETGEALGNFPQAFTHIGLISAALTLEEQEHGSMPAAAPAEASTTTKELKL